MPSKERGAIGTEIKGSSKMEFVVSLPETTKDSQKQIWWVSLAVFENNFWENCDIVPNGQTNSTFTRQGNNGAIEIVHGEIGSSLEILCYGRKVAEVDIIDTEYGAKVAQISLEKEFVDDKNIIDHLRNRGGVRVG